jgi:ABC-type polysaccharide/polyol phosphate export permease
MNKTKLKKFLKDVLAITEKELKLDLRFKKSYFLTSVINPLLGLIPFILIYFGFLTYSGAVSFAGINKGNYLNFLILGMLAFLFFNTGLNVFKNKFTNEKYWKTMEAIFLTPVKHVSIVIGVGLSEFIRMIPALIIFLGIASIFIPPSFLAIFFVLIALILMFLVTLGIGLIHGSLVITNEDYAPFFGYFINGWSLISCFFYPIGIIPPEFRGIVLINPVYQGLNFIRKAWMENLFLWDAMFYVLIFAAITPIIGGFLFRYLWKSKGISGY